MLLIKYALQSQCCYLPCYMLARTSTYWSCNLSSSFLISALLKTEGEMVCIWHLSRFNTIFSYATGAFKPFEVSVFQIRPNAWSSLQQNSLYVYKYDASWRIYFFFILILGLRCLLYINIINNVLFLFRGNGWSIIIQNTRGWINPKIW